MPKRTDANQAEIVAALRAIGATVQDTSAVGKGFPDIVVGFMGENHLIEIKNGNLTASSRRLTSYQVMWHNEWRGKVHVVKDVTEALAVLGAR
jgi:hypothetical protein